MYIINNNFLTMLPVEQDNVNDENDVTSMKKTLNSINISEDLKLYCEKIFTGKDLPNELHVKCVDLLIEILKDYRISSVSVLETMLQHSAEVGIIENLMVSIKAKLGEAAYRFSDIIKIYGANYRYSNVVKTHPDIDNNDDSLTEILPNLYLGSETEMRDERLLKLTGITHVLPVGAHLWDPRADNTFAEIKLEYYPTQINIFDCKSSDVLSHLSKTTEWIDNIITQNVKHKVLVHCAAGISRSATIVIAYIMWKNKWDYDKAFDFVKSKRSIISPNPGFRDQLKLYQDWNMKVDINTEAYKKWKTNLKKTHIKRVAFSIVA